MGVGLYPSQLEAIKKMHNGCILCGDVGTGKSRAALGYYFKQNGGEIEGDYSPMKNKPQDLYIITTARKRDSREWELDMAPFLLSSDKEQNLYSNTIIVDSWNNIQKYVGIKDGFFIFDEQRVVGKGAWVKAFLKITKVNKWILCTATPGDNWEDYVPVFLANGFYKNRTQFNQEHIIWCRFTTYPKIDRFVNTKLLERLRDQILIQMDDIRVTNSHHYDIVCGYDAKLYKSLIKDRWDPWENTPIENASKLTYLQRKVSNCSPDRVTRLISIIEQHPRCIIFYNFDYELDILRDLYKQLAIEFTEWNGHKHQPVPTNDIWGYFVQYSAGSEAWNCITTDTIIFFSQSYSYKTLHQACGRINRLNTPYKDLYYYHLKSKSPIDICINRALSNKKDFNERAYRKQFEKEFNGESN